METIGLLLLYRGLYDPGAQLVIDDRRVLRIDCQIDMWGLPKPFKRFMKPNFQILGVSTNPNSFRDDTPRMEGRELTMIQIGIPTRSMEPRIIDHPRRCERPQDHERRGRTYTFGTTSAEGSSRAFW